MELKSEREVENTRVKLNRLERLYEQARGDASISDFARATTMRSLKRFINQLKEEIAWFEAHHSVKR